MDQDEVGLVERVAISQDISCPGSDTNKFTIIETDTSGTALFPELQPGTYCVMYLGSKPITTRITQDIHLSSDQEAVVYFGLAE